MKRAGSKGGVGFARVLPPRFSNRKTSMLQDGGSNAQLPGNMPTKHSFMPMGKKQSVALQSRQDYAPSIAPSDMEFDLENWVDPAAKAYWRSQAVWKWSAALLILFGFMAATVAVAIAHPHTTVAHFYLWQYFAFIAGLALIYMGSEVLAYLTIKVMETTLLSPRTIYWLYRLRRRLLSFVRALLVLPLFCGCFSVRQAANDNSHGFYSYTARALACIALFFFANVLKSIFAKLMSGSFHRSSQFAKMEEALRKEYYLELLSRAPAPSLQALDTRLTAAEWAEQGLQQHISLTPSAAEPLPNGHGPDPPPAKLTGDFSQVFIKEEPDEVIRSPFDDQVPSPRSQASDFLEPIAEGSFKLDGDAAPPTPQPQAHHNHARDGNLAAHTFAMPPHLHRNSALSEGGPGVSVNGHASDGPSQPALGHPPSNRYARSSSVVVRRSHVAKQYSRQASRGLGRLSGRPKFVSFAPEVEQELIDNEERAEPAAFENSLESRESRDEFKRQRSREMSLKLHQLEKHFRKNKLRVDCRAAPSYSDTVQVEQVSFTEELSQFAQIDGEVSNKDEAKRIAFYLFGILKPADVERNHLLQEDLNHFLEPDEVVEAFSMLDQDKDGRVSLREMRKTIVNVYKERKHLALQLKDTKTVVGKLEAMCGIALHLIFILFYLVIFKVPAALWGVIIAVLAGVGWVFGPSVAQMYAASVYLFVVHPFDIGDLVMMRNDKTMYWVEEIALIACVVRRWDGARLWWPTNELVATPLVNITRSENKLEAYQLYVDINTPATLWDTVRSEVEDFTKAHPEHYSGFSQIYCFGAADPLKLSVQVVVEYSFTGTDPKHLNAARHDICMLLSRVLTEHDVRYSLPSFDAPFQPPPNPPSQVVTKPPVPPASVHRAVAVSVNSLAGSPSSPAVYAPIPAS